MTELLDRLASYADVPGLDWDDLNRSGNSVLQSDVYIDRLDSLFQVYLPVFESLNITTEEIANTTPETARTAWEMAHNAVSSKAELIFEAIGRGELQVAWDEAVEIHTAVLRNVVLGIHAMTMDALGSHDTGLVRYAVESGQQTVREAEADASTIARLWNCVILLDRSGTLDALKRSPGAVGAVPVAVALAASWPIALVLIGTIAIIATALTVMWTISEKNAERRRWCLEDNGDVRADAPEWCQEKPDDPLDSFLSSLKGGATSFGNALGVTLGIGMLAVGGYYALPRLMASRAKRAN